MPALKIRRCRNSRNKQTDQNESPLPPVGGGLAFISSENINANQLYSVTNIRPSIDLR